MNDAMAAVPRFILRVRVNGSIAEGGGIREREASGMKKNGRVFFPAENESTNQRQTDKFPP